VWVVAGGLSRIRRPLGRRALVRVRVRVRVRVSPAPAACELSSCCSTVVHWAAESVPREVGSAFWKAARAVAWPASCSAVRT